MITINNDGQKITSINYWDTEQALKGYLYLTWNAGAGRLLLPDSQLAFLPEMSTGKYVIVSRGPWKERGGREALELLFEDESDSPFCLQLVAEQCDRMLPDADQGGGFDIAVWTRDGEKLCLPGKYRRVSKIPYMKPWKAH